MKNNKKFQSFNDGIEKISDYLNRSLKKGSDIAQEVWIVTKRESQETKLAVEILGRLIRSEKVTEKEKEFLKRQSGDVARILPLIAIQGIPIPIPITPLLVVLGKKYGFDFLPKDHRSLLQPELQLLEDTISQLDGVPETGLGYHVVDLVLKNGRVLKERMIINSCKLVLRPGEEVRAEDIDEVSILI